MSKAVEGLFCLEIFLKWDEWDELTKRRTKDCIRRKGKDGLFEISSTTGKFNVLLRYFFLN